MLNQLFFERIHLVPDQDSGQVTTTATCMPPFDSILGLECSVFLGPWFLVVSGCVFAASQLVFDLVGGAVAER